MTLPVASFYVKNENTLGFVYHSEQPDLFNVLAGKPQIGGDDWRDGFVSLSSSDVLRAATEEDFAKFRVCSKNYMLN